MKRDGARLAQERDTARVDQWIVLALRVSAAEELLA